MQNEKEFTDEIICDPSDVISCVEIAYEPTNLSELSWYALSEFEKKNAKHIFSLKREFMKRRDYKKWLFDFARYVNVEPTFFEKFVPYFGVNSLCKRVEEKLREF
jgi:hypothetical protein